MNGPRNIEALLKDSPSPEVARQFLEWAGETRNRIARGDMMLGILTPEEVECILEAYRRAAAAGAPEAWLLLAWWHAQPDYGRPDLKASEEALRQAIEAGVENATLESVKLHWYFKRGTATEEEQAETYQRLRRIVEDDPENVEAVYFLAMLTTHGFGVPASAEEGFRLQQRAADMGSTDALFELFLYHAQGVGTEVDESKALEFCRRAAQAGHSRAMYNLGAFNALGRGMPKNMEEAAEWYGRAADAGNAMAMANLGAIYAMGDGVAEDRDHAAQLLDQAEYLGLDVSELRQQLGL